MVIVGLRMTEVILHVYDVTSSASDKTNNTILQINKIFKDGIGLGGIFHSAVQVFLYMQCIYTYLYGAFIRVVLDGFCICIFSLVILLTRSSVGACRYNSSKNVNTGSKGDGMGLMDGCYCWKYGSISNMLDCLLSGA